MDKGSGKVTVFFKPPFWVGVFERRWDGTVSVCRVTFGAEPKDEALYEFLLKHYDSRTFSPTVKVKQEIVRRNPKRIQREVHQQVQQIGIGTKSQQALQLQGEQVKVERKARSRQRREEEKERKFLLKQQKRKEKHRGR